MNIHLLLKMCSRCADGKLNFSVPVHKHQYFVLSNTFSMLFLIYYQLKCGTSDSDMHQFSLLIFRIAK
jgi:hypothetical protein